MTRRVAESVPQLFFGPSPRPGYAAEWRGGPPDRSLAPVVIGGCARSGTTLLRVLLDTHRRLCCGPESRLFEPRPIMADMLADGFDLAAAALKRLYVQARNRTDFVSRFARLYCATRGRPRWVEKTARNVQNLDYVLSAFPEARVINVIRDGRDVVCSLREHPKERWERSRAVPMVVCRSLGECLARWMNDVEASRPYWLHPRVLTVRYENLVRETEDCLRKVLTFLNEPWDGDLLDHSRIWTPARHPRKLLTNRNAAGPIVDHSISRWRRDLGRDERAWVERAAGSLLEELGY